MQHFDRKEWNCLNTLELQREGQNKTSEFLLDGRRIVGSTLSCPRIKSEEGSSQANLQVIQKESLL
jgi:hypothetical protein